MPGFEDFIGQSALKGLLRPKIQVANATRTALPHLLLCGDNGQGKITLAHRIAEELGGVMLCASATTLVKRLDLNGGYLVNLHARQVFTISDIDALPTDVAADLVQAISQFRVDIALGAGSTARVHELPLPRFTLIGTTTRPWRVDDGVRQWCIACQFSKYSEDEAAQLVTRIAQNKGLHLDQEAASAIAVQCKFNVGDANVFLQKIANHFSFGDGTKLDRAMVGHLTEFLGSGEVSPEILSIADHIRGMQGLDFEFWVADLFKKAGFSVEVTEASGDHGVDLWASTGACVIAVQCKRWDGSVGEPVLRDLYGAMTSAQAQLSCIVTTGSFTAQAHAFAKDKPIRLIDFDSLMDLASTPENLKALLSVR